MMKTERHRIGLPPQLRTLYIDRIPATLGALYGSTQQTYNPEHGVMLRAPLHVAGNGHWILPIHVGKDPLLGTFLYLYDDGKIERVTVRADEGDEVSLIKPADKDIQNEP